ncbi:hypothetical protein DHEL01_v207355 [Diaporthe helianthi]|uniref:Uncharacterized protein n=1 Tax=Diaporthe helianthi TaxID=158607 RepID=A0A2P5HVH9_DIAHE|nr:hypothetical protein DHEL01_v207355 [Diaporthe helianthi]
MSSPIDCSSTGASSGKHDDDEYEENIDWETTDGHTEAEIADDERPGFEEVEVVLMPHDNNPLRDRPVYLLTLISGLFALAAIMYSAHESLPAYLNKLPQMPAWLANLEPARPQVLVPLDVAGSVQAIVELYEPFMGDGVGLLAARSWPSGDIPSLLMHIIPAGDFKELGGTIAFFDDLSSNITEFCATVEINSIPAGDTWRPNQELEGLCRPLVTLSRSASTAYTDVA